MDITNQANNQSDVKVLQSLDPIGPNFAYTWFPATFHNYLKNSYINLKINLESITSYCIDKVGIQLANQKTEINDLLNSYLSYISQQTSDVPISYITSYCSTYTSYLIHNEVQKISANMINLVSKIKNNNNNSSYFRNNSKKISELTPRETITYHQNHSWIPLAQYDSRINSYVNISMNLDTITTYCNSYSTYINTYSSYVLDNRITYLQEHVEGTVSNNIISYAFSYSKDYFEWQFL